MTGAPTRRFASIAGLNPLSHLLANNRAWAGEMVRQDPQFFARLAQQQAPQYL